MPQKGALHPSLGPPVGPILPRDPRLSAQQFTGACSKEIPLLNAVSLGRRRNHLRGYLRVRPNTSWSESATPGHIQSRKIIKYRGNWETNKHEGFTMIIAVENHSFQWENQRFLWPCSIVMWLLT